MVEIAREFKRKKLAARLLMQIHDELVVECPDNEITEVTTILHEKMELIVSWDIPMSAEIGVGKNWLEAKK